VEINEAAEELVNTREKEEILFTKEKIEERIKLAKAAREWEKKEKKKNKENLKEKRRRGKLGSNLNEC
jgi:hypothetical protein